MYQNAPKPRVPRRPPPGRPAAAKPLVRSMSLPASMLPPPATATSRQLSRQSSFPASSEDDWQREVEEAYEEVVIKEHREVLFADVAEGHLHELPIVVELSRSLYGVCEDLTLTTGQKISVHFLKKTEVARVTGKRGSVLSVPINTSLRFSPMYEDVKEYSYASVKKLVSAKPPPLVVCVTEVCDPESSKSAPGILAGDILILKDGKRRAFLTGHVLWFNTRTYQDVRLNERCSMRFTAMSERTKLSLPVLLKHIGLPQMCFVYAGDNAQAAERRLIRRYFQEGICTLLCQNVESSFVASCIPEEMGGESRTLEIGTNFSIPVGILKTTGLPQRKLVEKSCELFWSFQPEMIDAFVGGEKEEPKAKLDLRKSVGKRGKMIGVTLVHPECLKPPASSHHDYGNLPFHTKREDERRPMETCPGGINALQKSLENLKLDAPKRRLTTVAEATEPIQFQKNQSYRRVSIMASEADIQQNNRDFLSKLECKQVLQLLDNMNLSAYKFIFEKENISGDLLLGFDDVILERELGVRSRIHRLKFMKLIRGQYSAEKFLLQSFA